MAAESLVIRQGVASGVPVAVIRLADRRPNVSAEQQEWAFQREVEAVLYGHGYSQQTGAVYRLLQRSGVRERALPLKKACIEQGLVTQLEFDSMYRHLSDVRSFTLIPLDALQTALATFGRSERSEALVAALGLERPDDWSDDDNDAKRPKAMTTMAAMTPKAKAMVMTTQAMPAMMRAVKLAVTAQTTSPSQGLRSQTTHPRLETSPAAMRHQRKRAPHTTRG